MECKMKKMGLILGVIYCVQFASANQTNNQRKPAQRQGIYICRQSIDDKNGLNYVRLEDVNRDLNTFCNSEKPFQIMMFGQQPIYSFCCISK